MRQRLLWPRLTSRSVDSQPSAVSTSPFQARGETSQGKARDLRSIYPPHIRPLGPDGYRASGDRAPSPTSRTPLMRFVFLGPELCLQLPPRGPSRDHACCSARGSQPPGPPGDFHPQVTSRSAFASRFTVRLSADRAMPGAHDHHAFHEDAEPGDLGLQLLPTYWHRWAWIVPPNTRPRRSHSG